jgi:hypothetical protein
MTLAFPYPDKRICVMTDAFICFYASLVTQVDEEQLDLLMEEQDHHSSKACNYDIQYQRRKVSLSSTQ